MAARAAPRADEKRRIARAAPAPVPDPREVRNPWGDPVPAERRRDRGEEMLRWRILTAMVPAPLPAPARRWRNALPAWP